MEEVTKRVEVDPIEEDVKEDANSLSASQIQPSKEQRLRNVKAEEKEFKKLAEVIHKLVLTLPFSELNRISPIYREFMKRSLSSQRSSKGKDPRVVKHECNVLISKTTPTKVEDPGRFSVPCTIGETHFEDPLADLGASVSVMSLLTYKNLGLGGMKPARVILSMADGSAIKPNGIVEDVPVKVGRFTIPCDFLVVSTKSELSTPLILGRPFLATAKAKIEVASGKLTFEVGGETMEVESLARKHCALKVETQATPTKEPRVEESEVEEKAKKKKSSRAMRRARRKLLKKAEDDAILLSQEAIQKKFAEIVVGAPNHGDTTLKEAPS